jgi:DNA-binding response OmpR family regulator
MNILVDEDDSELASALVGGLEEEEFHVQLCGEGKPRCGGQRKGISI